MSHEPWAIRLPAFIGRLFLFVGRGIFAAIGTDPQAAMVFSVAGLAVLLSLPLALRALIVSERWIARHVKADALDREYAALCATYSLDELTDASDAEYLPGVAHLGPAAPPPVRRAVRRRRMPSVRIPGRYLRPSDFKRKARS